MRPRHICNQNHRDFRLVTLSLLPQLLLLCAVTHFSGATLLAQQPSQSSNAPILSIKVDTKLTVEDVTVSDDHHKPVHGLVQSDFTIKEDGRSQLIRHFEELGDEKPSPQQVTPLQLPPNTYTNAQMAPPDTHTISILMLDGITTCSPSTQLSDCLQYMVFPRNKALNYLSRMPQGTQVAIFKLQNGLHLIQGLTADKEILKAAMNTTGFSLPSVSIRRRLVGVEDLCDRVNDRHRAVLDALEQEAAYLSGLKGRKNLIWFTYGIPSLTDYKYSARYSCVTDYTERLHRIYGLLNAAQIALYPVDPRGPGVMLPDAGYDSMQDLAKATGGVAYIGRNDLDTVIEEAIATGSDYYSLSYVPPSSKYDGQYHKIDVAVDRPHLNLQYRVGYTSIDLDKAPKPSEQPGKDSPKPEQQSLSPFDVAMGHGVIPSTQILFNVSITPSTTPTKADDPVIGKLDPSMKGKHLVRYNVAFALPADQIALADDPNGTKGVSMQFVVAAYDAEGKMVNYHGQFAKVSLKPDQVARFKQQSFPMKMQIDLPAGKIFVRAGLLDVISQKTGSLEVPETVVK